MTLQDFAAMTVRVIREDGIDGYLPTILLPASRHILCVEGIPDNFDHRDAVQNFVWRSGYETQEFFFGVQTAHDALTVGHFRPGQRSEFMTITGSPEGYSATTLASCEWWRV